MYHTKDQGDQQGFTHTILTEGIFGSLEKSPSEFAEVMASVSCRHVYTQCYIRPQSFSCSGPFTLQDLHLSGIVVHLLKGNTTENSGWNFPTPKLTINFGFVSLSKIAPSHSEQQTQLYDPPYALTQHRSSALKPLPHTSQHQQNRDPKLCQVSHHPMLSRSSCQQKNCQINSAPH